MQYIECDITTVERGIIAQGVNCQHAMGSGVALAILRKWPEVREAYMRNLSGGQMLGTTHIINVGRDDSLWVANCYTQEYFGSDGKMYASVEAIHNALAFVFEHARIYELPVYLPKIGAGLGGLDWELDVEPIINHYDDIFDTVDTTICIWG